jgi:hypothetical protein
VQSVSGAPTFSRTPPQTIVASTEGYTNMNKSLASAREGDAMIAQLIQSVKRATAGASDADSGSGTGTGSGSTGTCSGTGTGGGAFDFCFTSSSPVAVLQMRDAWDARLMRLHHQGTLRLDEARKLAQMRRTRFCDLTAAYVVSRGQDGDDDDEDEEEKSEEKEKDGDKSKSEQPSVAAPSVGSAPAPSESAQATAAATTPLLPPPPPFRKSAHPDFLFAGAPALSRPRVGAEQSGKDPATAAKTCGNDKPAAGAAGSGDDAGDAPRVPLPPIVVDGAWDETEFHRVVAMVGLSPIFLRTVYDSQRPLEQAKRVLGARLLSLTPYMFTNNFAMEEAWQSGGMPALTRLLTHRCEAVRLLESVYADQARAQAAEAAEAPASWWPFASSSSSSSSSAGWLQCSPTVALSETNDADCRAITARLDRLSLSASSSSSSLPSSTPSSKNSTGSGAAAADAAAADAAAAGRANLRAVAQSTIGATMLDSGVLSADIDGGALRIATVAHARAFERLRARQRLAPIGAACTAFGVPPTATKKASSSKEDAAASTAPAPLTEEQLLDSAGKMSATLKTTNMWL